jgi:hypothetical protein
MDRTDEVIYLAGLPGVPRMILWVKFSVNGGEAVVNGGKKTLNLLYRYIVNNVSKNIL